MVKIIVTDVAGDSREIEADEGISLMENIRANDFSDLAAICGGCCSCCSCHVHVDEDWYGKLQQPEEDESCLLEESDFNIEKSSRLSCQLEVTDIMDGLKITLVSEV